ISPTSLSYCIQLLIHPQRPHCLSRTADHPRAPRTFPTRRSSDLTSVAITSATGTETVLVNRSVAAADCATLTAYCRMETNRIPGDRKSTRLNSSHVKISYAVFCLKKNTSKNRHNGPQPESDRRPR